MHVARKVLLAVIAAFVAVNSVACSIDGVPVAAKANEAPLSKLMPLATNSVVTGSPDLSCDNETRPVSLKALLGTRELVEHTDRVWVDKVNPVSKQQYYSEAIYTFSGALPTVRSVIVTFGAKSIILPGTWTVDSDVSYKATWPKEAATGPVRVSMKSQDFADQVQTLRGITLCMA